MPYDEMEVAMSKRELIAREVNHLPEPDLDKLLAFLSSLEGRSHRGSRVGTGRRIIALQRLAYA
jgi:hypothetical protein